MLTGSLLDQAFADARAVRETAYANAKQALESAFSMKYKSVVDDGVEVLNSTFSMQAKSVVDANRNMSFHILEK